MRLDVRPPLELQFLDRIKHQRTIGCDLGQVQNGGRAADLVEVLPDILGSQQVLRKRRHGGWSMLEESEMPGKMDQPLQEADFLGYPRARASMIYLCRAI